MICVKKCNLSQQKDKQEKSENRFQVKSLETADTVKQRQNVVQYFLSYITSLSNHISLSRIIFYFFSYFFQALEDGNLEDIEDDNLKVAAGKKRKRKKRDDEEDEEIGPNGKPAKVANKVLLDKRLAYFCSQHRVVLATEGNLQCSLTNKLVNKVEV